MSNENTNTQNEDFEMWSLILTVFQHETIEDFKEHRTQFQTRLDDAYRKCKEEFSDKAEKFKNYGEMYLEYTKKYLSFYDYCQEEGSDKIFRLIIPKKTKLQKIAQDNKLDYEKIEEIAVQLLAKYMTQKAIKDCQKDQKTLEDAKNGILGLIGIRAANMNTEAFLSDLNKKIDEVDLEYAKMELKDDISNAKLAKSILEEQRKEEQ
jgi:hypothetical protein